MRTLVFDIECYKNYFLALFMDVDSGETFKHELFEGQPLSVPLIKSLLNSRIITFNGRNYDIPMLSLALTGADNLKLKELSDAIIVNGVKYWDAEKLFNFLCIKCDHVDLIEVAVGKTGLKTYGGRIHSEKIQDLPIEPDAEISPEERETLVAYCANDLRTTNDLYTYLLPQLRLRAKLTKEYGIDLRSKSDAQIAEAVIARELEKIKGYAVTRPTLDHGMTFQYNVPSFIAFKTPELQELLEDVKIANFGVGADGVMLMPKALDGRIVDVGGKDYALGIGGLHSREKKQVVKADGFRILDRDVTSYYPSIILNCGLYPKHIGKDFLTVYKSIVDRRVAAKHSGDKVTADCLKIVANGSYGKLGSVWSKLFAPELLIQTTITGQLSLLMLIEAFELDGNEVISSNTDGVTIKCTDEGKYLQTVIAWEKATGFNTEETEYVALYSRDVNNYVAVKPDGKVKTKGAFAIGGLSKNPVNEICVEAVIKYLASGEDIERTIRSCDDIRKFITIRSVTGSAVKDGLFLGKAVRWYYAVGEKGTINYKKNGNKVPRSEGAKPLMEINGFPPDVDYGWYIEEANNLLEDLGCQRLSEKGTFSVICSNVSKKKATKRVKPVGKGEQIALTCSSSGSDG